jgi:hypothetical protein
MGKEGGHFSAPSLPHLLSKMGANSQPRQWRAHPGLGTAVLVPSHPRVLSPWLVRVHRPSALCPLPSAMLGPGNQRPGGGAGPGGGGVPKPQAGRATLPTSDQVDGCAEAEKEQGSCWVLTPRRHRAPSANALRKGRSLGKGTVRGPRVLEEASSQRDRFTRSPLPSQAQV